MSGHETNRYKQLIEHVFFDPPYGYVSGTTEVPFKREQLEAAAATLNIKLPKNIGDVLYAFRYRVPLPARILRSRFGSHGAGSRLRFGCARRCSMRRIMARVTMASDTSGRRS